MTHKQQRFCQEYMIDLNATQAALRAGYSTISARQMGSDTLSKPYIKVEIDRLRADLAVKAEFGVMDAHKLYKRAYVQAEQNKQTGAMVGAVTGIARLYGMDKDAGGGEKTIIIISPKVVKPNITKVIVNKELE